MEIKEKQWAMKLYKDIDVDHLIKIVCLWWALYIACMNNNKSQNALKEKYLDIEVLEDHVNLDGSSINRYTAVENKKLEGGSAKPRKLRETLNIHDL